MTKKPPKPVDKHVGARVRMRRMMLSMSQEKLGDALGLTFQQVQKYEKGTNRIGSSRMVQIARALQVPVAWFFEGTENGAAPLTIGNDPMAAFCATREGLIIATWFPKIADTETRRVLCSLIERRGRIDANAGE